MNTSNEKSIIDKLKKYKEAYVVIAFFVGLAATLFMFLHQFLIKFDETISTIKTTQQMALKSVIWNDNIPVGERVSACDIYIKSGYNSLTKKECQHIIDSTEVSFNNKL